MSNYLVTGGAGFIGSHLAEELTRRGSSVRVVDNLATGKRENIAHLREVEFIEGDIVSSNLCEDSMKDIDFVSHQAALGSVPRSIENPIKTNQVNINGFLNVWVTCSQFKNPVCERSRKQETVDPRQI